MEDVKSYNHTSPVTSLEDVGIASVQFRANPVLEELDAVLEFVGLPEDRRISRVGGFLPNLIRQSDQSNAILRYIAANECPAGEDREERQLGIRAQFLVPLPCPTKW